MKTLHDTSTDTGRRVAITGAGVVTPIGIGLPAFLDALRETRQCLGRLEGVPIPRGKAAVGVVRDPRLDGPDRAFRMARLALAEALDQSPLSPREGDGVALILSTLAADNQTLEDRFDEFDADGRPGPGIADLLPLYSNGTLCNRLANRVRADGPRLTVSCACASGNIALGIALDMIRLGRCRSAIVCGVELAKLTMIWGAERAGFIGRALRPFHRTRDGSVLGEGAGALILQRAADVPADRVLGWVEGFGCGVDLGAAAITLLDDGSGLKRGMAMAVADAGRCQSEIEYVNAHAPGTPLIDRLECKAIAELFGERAPSIAVNSTKSLTSHMSAASAIVDVVATLLQMEHGFMHGHAGLDDPDPELAVPVVGAAPVSRQVSVGLSNACGGGGLNTSVLIASPATETGSTVGPSHPDMPVVITGTGAVSSCGTGASDLFLTATQAAMPGRLQTFDITDWYPKSTNFSFFSRCGQLGAAAGYLAIKDARLEGAYAADRVAVISGTLLGGTPEMSAVLCGALLTAPDRIVPSMALDHGPHLSTAMIRRYFGLNGLTYTFTGSTVAGLTAVAVAHDLLRCHRADAVVIVGHDALDKPLAAAAPWLDECLPADRLGEGAGAVVLERAADAHRRAAPERTRLVASVSLAARLDDADSRRRAACALQAALSDAEWDVVYLAAPFPDGLEALEREIACRRGRREPIVSHANDGKAHCMAADAVLSLAAAAARGQRALVLAAEPHGAIVAAVVDGTAPHEGTRDRHAGSVA